MTRAVDWIAGFALAVLFSTISQGEIIVVREDGSGDYGRIGDALVAAQDGDEVVVFPGLYDENEDGEPRLAYISDRRIVLRGTGSVIEVKIRGLVVASVNGAFTCRQVSFAEDGPAIVGSGGDLVIENCRFEDMFGEASAAIEYPTGRLEVIDSVFSRCHSATGGAIWGDEVFISGTSFVDCEGRRGAAITAGIIELDRITFTGVHALGENSSIVVAIKLAARSCTWWSNGAGRAIVLVVNAVSFNAVDFESCIMSRNDGSASVETDGKLRASCCDFFENPPWEYLALDTTDVLSVDPIFCDPMAFDFHIHSDSRCAPGNGPVGCDLIGSGAVGCGVTAARGASWGQLKVRFR